MKTCLVVAACLAGCATDFDPDVRVERQNATVASASAADWTEGGAVLVGEPGTFVFPQPLALRVSIVDSKSLDSDGNKTQLAIDSASVELVGAGQLEVVSTPTCQENFCVAELRVLAAGASMLEVAGTGPDGTQHECIYYGIYEDADPAAGTTHRAELEMQQDACRATF